MKIEVAILGSPSPNSPYGYCGRKAALSLNLCQNDVSLVLSSLEAEEFFLLKGSVMC